MRTTVTIDDELLEAARERARLTGRTLGSVLEAGLRRELAAEATTQRMQVPVFQDGTGPRPGIDLTSNAALAHALDDGVALERLR